jgi:HD-GYP domain-containing protein (c-di-GMP phosphodiesterase class II)
MMEALGRAIAKRDSDTGAHNYRVAWIAARIAERLGLSGSAMQALIAGSFLHDVGKIGIPDAILLKPGRLDEQEMDTMRTHVAQGEEIVTGMGWLDGAQAVVAAHHEKWNGSGYPRGLAGEAIPLAARIFAVADVFDALCSKRPYKEPGACDHGDSGARHRQPFRSRGDGGVSPAGAGDFSAPVQQQRSRGPATPGRAYPPAFRNVRTTGSRRWRG